MRWAPMKWTECGRPTHEVQCPLGGRSVGVWVWWPKAVIIARWEEIAGPALLFIFVLYELWYLCWIKDISIIHRWEEVGGWERNKPVFFSRRKQSKYEVAMWPARSMVYALRVQAPMCAAAAYGWLAGEFRWVPAYACYMPPQRACACYLTCINE